MTAPVPGPVVGVGDVERCQLVEIDGETVRVQGTGAWTDEDRAALGEVVRAARAKLVAMPPGPLSVVCPVCSSAVAALCRNDAGRVTGVHAERRQLVST